MRAFPTLKSLIDRAWSRRAVIATGALVMMGVAGAWAGWAPDASARDEATRILLISATDDPAVEQSLGVALDTLRDHQISYDRFIATENGAPRPGALLPLEDADGQPLYSGILLTTNKLFFQDADGNWQSGLTPSQWEQLDRYEETHRIRRVALYSTPTTDIGVESAGDGNGAATQLVAADGADYRLEGLSTLAPLSLDGAWHYPSRVVDAATAAPLLYFADENVPADQRPVAALVAQLQDGREQLHFFFAQSRDQAVSRLLAPLWLAWLNERQAPAEHPFLGTWTASFLGFDTQSYGGPVTVSGTPAGFDLAWTIGAAQYAGPALLLNDRLYAAWGGGYGNTGIVVYQIAEDGSLIGTYRQNGEAAAGEETISRVNLLAAQGLYSLNGVKADGTNYDGQVRITKFANTYQLDYYQDGRVIPSVGFVEGDKLIVGYSTYLPFGVVSYDREGDRMSGRWVRFGVDAIYQQTLTRPVQ
jgi:hypothetical protein